MVEQRHDHWTEMNLSDALRPMGRGIKTAYSATTSALTSQTSKQFAKWALLPAIAFGAIGGGLGYSTRGTPDNSGIELIQEKEFEGDTYLLLDQKNGLEYEFLTEGRTGRNLSTLEEEAIGLANDKYNKELGTIQGKINNKIKSINGRYDSMIESATIEAQKAWGKFKVPETPKEPEKKLTQFQEIRKLVGEEFTGGKR